MTAVRLASAWMLAGGLVAFPTETVYGLGGLAMVESSVRSIFEAKGRPSRNPLIVHIESVSCAAGVVSEWPERAEALAAAFWPGPLTLVVPRSAEVPDVTVACGTTVAVRCPRHVVARSLLAAVGAPVAAPSANRSSRVSATTAEHVVREFGDMESLMVLDGGVCEGGIESTVVDVTVTPARILRPGLLVRRDIERVIGPVDFGPAADTEGIVRSPGSIGRHYAPRAMLVAAGDDCAAVASTLSEAGKMTALLAFGAQDVPGSVHVVEASDDPAEYGHSFYAALRRLDDDGFDRIVVQVPPDLDEWRAVRDRIARASLADTEATTGGNWPPQ